MAPKLKGCLTIILTPRSGSCVLIQMYVAAILIDESDSLNNSSCWSLEQKGGKRRGEGGGAYPLIKGAFV